MKAQFHHNSTPRQVSLAKLQEEAHFARTIELNKEQGLSTGAWWRWRGQPHWHVPTVSRRPAAGLSLPYHLSPPLPPFTPLPLT